MELWWQLQDAFSELIRAVIGLIRASMAWYFWRRRQLARAYKSMTLGTFFAVLSSIATVCAAAASAMSYKVSVDSQRVADESLAVTKAIDARNQLQQRAIVTVKNANFSQHMIQNSSGTKVVTTVSLSLRNSGHNSSRWIRLRGGEYATQFVESHNPMSNDSEQSFVLEFEDLKLENGIKFHFGFEYWDEELKKCFYGQTEYKLVRDPNTPGEFTPTPFNSGKANDDILLLKQDSFCSKFTTEVKND